MNNKYLQNWILFYKSPLKESQQQWIFQIILFVLGWKMSLYFFLFEL